jgi:microcystin-dependent protein
MANIEVKLRRGTDTEHSSFTGAEGEVTVDTTNNTLRVHDNSTAGGIRLAKLSEVGGLSDDSVTFAKMQNINTAKVIGRTTAGSGDPEEVSILDDDTMATASATSLATSESIKAYVDSEIGIPTGTVSAFAGSSAPTGYALCDGSAVNRTTQAALFAVIGTTYGVGDGSTTFNLPDLRGRVVAGMGGGLLSGTDALGDTGGAATHTLTEAEMPSHSHDYFRAPADRIGSGAGSARVEDRSNNTEQTTDTGGDQAHNNVQPTIILNYIIKT